MKRKLINGLNGFGRMYKGCYPCTIDYEPIPEFISKECLRKLYIHLLPKNFYLKFLNK